MLAGLAGDRRMGVGVLNQKEQRLETVEEVIERAEPAIRLSARSVCISLTEPAGTGLGDG